MKATGKRKRLVGIVESNMMDKTVVVKVDRLVMHPKFKKYVKKYKKYKAHDEKNICNVGDVVELIETRPLSKEKRWRVSSILRREAILEKDEVS